MRGGPQRDFEKLRARFGAGMGSWGSVVALLCRGGSDGKARCDEIAAFFVTHDVGSAKRRVEQATEGLMLRSSRLDRDRATVPAFLA